MKPIGLMSYPIRNSTMTNGIVLDPFLGSGSTLIACEETDRVCRGIELDPKFVDVIVKRYIEHSEGRYVGSGHRYYDNSGSSRASEHGDHQEIHRNQRSPAERMCIGGESRMTEDKPISLRSQSVFAPYIKDFVQQKQSLGLK